VTEDQAKTKWCPFARYVIDAQTVFPTGNRFEGQETSQVPNEAAKGCLCIASDCMAWRWRPVDLANGGQFGDGNCGLAGEPK
jgi:hypothetical protein